MDFMIAASFVAFAIACIFARFYYRQWRARKNWRHIEHSNAAGTEPYDKAEMIRNGGFDQRSGRATGL